MFRFTKVSLCYDDVFSSLTSSSNLKSSLNSSFNGNIYYIDRADTAAESVTLFMKWLSNIGVKMNRGGGIMIGVGLTCGGRGSSYTMVYNAKEKILFAIDNNDKNYVCQVCINEM